MQMSFNGFFPPNFMLQLERTPNYEHEETHPQAPFFPGGLIGVGRRPASFSGIEQCEEMNVAEEELSDDGSAVGEKKRRLTVEQVRALERSFETGSKLEPERKMQLARALGLRPRQIAIWFQNRRARWKTKQLEKDYDALKREYEAVKSENEALQSHNKKLQAEVMALRGTETPELINLNKETEGSCSNRSENTIEINLECRQGLPFFPPYEPEQRPEDQCVKLEHGTHEECLSTMFGGIDDHSTFWPWAEH